MHVHDPVALGAALWPQLFRTQQLWGDVETTGELTAGQLIVDQRALASDQERLGRLVACAMDVDQTRFLELFTNAYYRIRPRPGVPKKAAVGTTVLMEQPQQARAIQARAARGRKAGA